MDYTFKLGIVLNLIFGIFVLISAYFGIKELVAVDYEAFVQGGNNVAVSGYLDGQIEQYDRAVKSIKFVGVFTMLCVAIQCVLLWYVTMMKQDVK